MRRPLHRPPIPYHYLSQCSPDDEDSPNVQSHRVFITSIHWNNEKILRSSWNAAVISLVQYFGPSNVYISIYESGSWDDTKGALRQLDEELATLNVPRSVILDETTHAQILEKGPDAEGWIDTKAGKKELRRIPYLSRLRNLALQPLTDLDKENSTRFDKTLFLNDVAFTTADVASLLATRDGDYAAACSLDFAKPPYYYDTFALRDTQGHEAASSTFPFFRSRASRKAILAHEPIPVRSCWNGIVAFDAAPFYSTHSSQENEQTSTPGLRFRGISDALSMKHLEGSECCLVHVDNPLSSTRGVWVNPNVRVGYSLEAYEAMHPKDGQWPGSWGTIAGAWRNRVMRWATSPRIKEGVVRRRVDAHGKESGEKEKGEVCLINEMQVLRGNGWAHV
ncbi:uncharacterized protein KY384_005158 [Bacidia gigantensis]|uniref:uncharacterized protein n=1 Tax=Bacidia gigantensis TaxID=2732470 RepID=UPI001D038918|nr:uncharacterized protein KY384_005158 [Bacidia gigantensis]KAG8529677.1 hypothetical protein KY384_005158 [Bacidia gigantensis]